MGDSELCAEEACGASTTHLGARTKLQLPLELASLKGLTTDNDLETCVLISSASNPFQLTLSDRCAASEPACLSTCKVKSKECKNKCPHCKECYGIGDGQRRLTKVL